MRNTAEHVLEQVTALANQSAGEVDFEVIWVDNGSSDDTLQLVSDSIRGDDRMRVISAPEVRSSYFARNQGVAAAKGDLVLFCDADDVVDKHWIQSMVTALADLDVVGGSLKFGIDEAATVETAPVHAFLPAAALRTWELARVRSRRLVASTARCARVRTGRSAGGLSLRASGSASTPAPSCCIEGGERVGADEAALDTGAVVPRMGSPIRAARRRSPNDPRRTQPNRRPSHPPGREAPPGPRACARRCLEPRRHLVERVEAEANRALRENAKWGPRRVPTSAPALKRQHPGQSLPPVLSFSMAYA